MEYEVVEQNEIECLSPKDVIELLKLSKNEVYQLFNSKDFHVFYWEKEARELLRETLRYG